MITLYHGSNVFIEKIDLTRSHPDKDFDYFGHTGRGTYISQVKSSILFWHRTCLANPYPTMNEQIAYLTSSLVEQLALLAMKDYGLTMIEALFLVYNSQWYEKITDIETGLYIQSPAYNYQLLRHEITFGKVI